MMIGMRVPTTVLGHVQMTHHKDVNDRFWITAFHFTPQFPVVAQGSTFNGEFEDIEALDAMVGECW